MPAYIADLEAAVAGGCSAVGCDHTKHGPLYLHGKCHPGSSCEVSYAPGSGMLQVACRKCGRLIVAVAVAAGPAVEPAVEPVPPPLDVASDADE